MELNWLKTYTIPMIETPRLIIRPFQVHDGEAFAILMADPEVMRYSISGPLTDRAKVDHYFQKRIIDHYAERGYGLYAVFEREKDQFIGYVGLIDQNIEGENKVELGYRLFPQFWGQGLASEACRAVTNYAFTTLGLKELISIIDPHNARSLNVAKALGMQLWKSTSFHQIPVQIYRLPANFSGSKDSWYLQDGSEANSFV